MNLDASMFKSLYIALPPFSLLLSAPFVHAQQPMDNPAIIQLATSGTSEEQIVQMISTSAGHYDAGADAVAALKTAGVTDKEVDAMRKKNVDTYAAAVAAAAAVGGTVVPPGVHGIGVYYKDPKSDTWVEFKPETFYYSTPKGTGPFVPLGGDIGVAVGLVLLPVEIAYALNHPRHNDRNGYIAGKAAQLVLNHPVDILIYTPEDIAPKAYHLLKLRADPDKPDVRIFERGGAVNEAGASKRDRQTFQATKLGFRFYQISLGPEYPTGEYGILLPDAATKVPGRSEILTFRVPD
jgi:hypothetical protein